MKMKTLPIVPWIGGKRRLAKHILPLFPAHECYVEPFCGAAALIMKERPARHPKAGLVIAPQECAVSRPRFSQSRET